jgi:phage-related protein
MGDTSQQTTSDVLTTKFGEGYEQSAPDGPISVRDSYPLLFQGTPAQMKEIADFLKAKGGYIPFMYTVPGVGVQQQFLCKSWKRALTFPVDQLTATFEQNFNIG